MADIGRGLPLLSGPPPPNDSPNAEIACRKCNKEFNVLFTRARKCSHCGYQYCHSCSDYQALMPRPGAERGYDAMNVCAFCIELLTVTAAGRHQMKTMSLAKLKKYTTAYNIKIDRVVEKDDLIDAILASKGPNGCLSRANENYYRKYSVPNRVPPSSQNRSRGFFSSRNHGSSSSAPPPPPAVPPRPDPQPEFARPDLAPDNPPPPIPPRTGPMPQFPRPDLYSERPPPHANSYPQSSSRPPRPQQQEYTPPPNPPPRPHSAYGNTPPYNPPPNFYAPPPRPHPSEGYGGYPGQAYHQNYSQRTQPPQPPPPPQSSRPPPRQAPPRPTSQRPPQSQSRAQPQAQPSQTQPPPPPRPRATSTAPPPNLDTLVTMTDSAISSLSISALKSILFTNHVNAGQILEKSDLVKKVLTLVENEKADRERQRQADMREEMERVQREMERESLADLAAGADDGNANAGAGGNADANRQSGDGMSGGGTVSSSDEVDREDGNASGTPSSPPRAAPAPAPVPKVQGSATTLERTGLCVICQDEEANIAIVDCGHMAMCRGCSDLVMSSSRECPLCRTRIVTEARLLRIFKT